MSSSRIKNTVRNINAGLINQIITIILPFINRTAILWTLGAEFTGLASLFSSILNVLNIAELGFNTAVVYSLYKPMAEHNEKKICEIVSLLKKIYSIIGIIVLVIGLSLMPALPFLIKGSYPSTINIYVLYLLYLINSAISYHLFAYKECLLIADQRQDIAKNIRTIVNIVRYLLQLIILLITKNFYAYLVVAILGTIATNLVIEVITRKKYPYYKRVNDKLKIPAEMKKEVNGLMINKICDTFRNSFDSLIISSFIGLTATAIYSNYYYIYSSLYGIMLVICNAMSASVGNSIVQKTAAENYDNMLTFSFAFSWILGIATTCLGCLYQPFMTLWAGSDLLLPTFSMLMFCLYFYTININNIRNQYISGTGMWWKLKFSYIIEALANLLLNIILGKLLGIAGVILATILTIFFLNFLLRNKILFANYFKSSDKCEFYKEQIYYFILTLISFGSAYYVTSIINYSNIIINIIGNGLISLIISLIIMTLGLSFTKRYKESKKFINQVKKTFKKFAN